MTIVLRPGERPEIKTSVIVPVWNRADLTMRWLNTHWNLYRSKPDVEVVIVNNGSTDTTEAVLRQWIQVYGDSLQVVMHATNQGFSAGNNAGVKVARGSVLVFTSNDVIVEGDYLAKIEHRLEGQDILLGATMLTIDTGWNRFRGVMVEKGPDGRREPEPTIIPYLAGHLVAANRLTWETLGGWDELYHPSDYEDMDLSYTAITMGIPLVAIALPIKHLFGQSAGQIQGGREQVTLKNRALFMQKWWLQEP